MFFTLLLVTVAFIIIILLEVPRLVVQKKWRDLAAFSFLLLPAIVYSYGITLDVNLPNPTHLIIKLFDPLALRLEQLLGTTQ
ncbi:hypothetical protein [Desulforamulus aeronauticus]|uniref:Uncharacterized protein n=1 Tax=Desulforamulus aeronauticus DSM 10349 TaxID=1121421 RepID=A0A1M6RMP4_9FIRM|nr:hypothetical protein [Desulforamulus aeronauticus]SHK33709.1 hypothetical protein SAMN02745123_01527 [Desulforamulus aeronauticus DSM 10349]